METARTRIGRPAGAHSATTYAQHAHGYASLIGVTIVTEVIIAIYDARSEPTRDRVATRALAGLDARRASARATTAGRES